MEAVCHRREYQRGASVLRPLQILRKRERLDRRRRTAKAARPRDMWNDAVLMISRATT